MPFGAARIASYSENAGRLTKNILPAITLGTFHVQGPSIEYKEKCLSFQFVEQVLSRSPQSRTYEFKTASGKNSGGFWNSHSIPVNSHCSRQRLSGIIHLKYLMTAPTKKPAANQVDRRRRRHPRYRADFRLTATYLDGSHYRKLEGHCRDLSEAGIGILLAVEMNNGEVVGLNFAIPGNDLVWELRAVVRYRRGYHYGFEFLSLTNDQRETLKTYLTGLEPMD
jgi:PilZ domain